MVAIRRLMPVSIATRMAAQGLLATKGLLVALPPIPLETRCAMAEPEARHLHLMAIQAAAVVAHRLGQMP